MRTLLYSCLILALTIISQELHGQQMPSSVSTKGSLQGKIPLQYRNVGLPFRKIFR